MLFWWLHSCLWGHCMLKNYQAARDTPTNMPRWTEFLYMVRDRPDSRRTERGLPVNLQINATLGKPNARRWRLPNEKYLCITKQKGSPFCPTAHLNTWFKNQTLIFFFSKRATPTRERLSLDKSWIEFISCSNKVRTEAWKTSLS